MIQNMTHSQESRVSNNQEGLRLSEESIASMSALVNKYTGIGIEVGDGDKLGAESNQEESKMESVFPWLKNFGNLCRSSLSSKNVKLLENLMTVYLQHVSIDVKNCYMKPNRAAKLKKCMNEALLFFHMFYQDVREPMEQSFYLNKMTDLLSMYIDMEIKASRRRKETTKKIVSRLTSALFIFLDHSQLHMLDSILKAKLITKANKEICIPILRKLMNSLHMTPLYEMLYVRCVLVFKLWKKMILKDADEKKRVTQLAVKKLNVAKNFLDKSNLLVEVLPRIPKSKKNITMFFMQAKFNLKTACKAFLKISKESQPLMDKSLFFGEPLGDSPAVGGDKTFDVGDGRNSNLFNNIWSSISVENETLSIDKEKPDIQPGKKQKNKEKRGKKAKKSKANKNATGSIEERNKKKKKVKKKSLSGDTASVQDGPSADITDSLQVPKGEDKKKEKLQLCESEETPGKATAQTQVQEELISSEQMVVVKTEENVQDLCIVAVVGDTSNEPEEQGMNQVNKINSVGSFIPQEIKENLEPTSPGPLPVALVMEAAEPAALEQVNQVNSACSELEALRIGQDIEQVSNNDNSKNETAPSANVNRIIGESVIVPANSNTFLIDSVLNTSQKQQQAATVENEAIANRVEQETSRIDVVMSPKILHPYLVQTPSIDGSEITHIVPPREIVSYACDSSIKVEDPMHEDTYIVTDQDVPIPKEGPGGVDNDFFNRIMVEYDSDVEILDTRQCSMPEREEVLVRSERDLLPRDTVPSNIFATENSDLFIEALGGVLPESGIDYEPRGVLGSEDGVLDNPFLCGGDEGTELESPSSEPIDENEKRSFTSMMNNIRSSKDKELFAQFGTERQEWLERNGHRFMYGDSMLGLHQSSVISSDDDGDSCYEYNSNSASSSPRQRIGGGKVGSQNYATSVNEKEVSDSSPSSNISDSSLASNNTIRDSYSKLGSGFSGRDTPSRPQVGQKTPAPGLTRSSLYPFPTSTPCVPTSPVVSTYKTLNVNLMKCKDRKVVSDQKKPRRTTRLVTSNDDGNRNYVESSVEESSDKFSGIVDDAHNATDKSEKGAATQTSRQKASSRGTLSSETGNNAVVGQASKRRGRPRGSTRKKETVKQSKNQRVLRPGCSNSEKSYHNQSSGSSEEADERPSNKKKASMFKDSQLYYNGPVTRAVTREVEDLKCTCTRNPYQHPTDNEAQDNGHLGHIVVALRLILCKTENMYSEGSEFRLYVWWMV
ncbi:uncharacterized protein [Periplaneta americana]|uniref:uncharacterized protein isoform X3 n=1 Tax=Periplaneta americana TaxID=6978 RepID=UPI0037E7ACEB